LELTASLVSASNCVASAVEAIAIETILTLGVTCASTEKTLFNTFASSADVAQTFTIGDASSVVALATESAVTTDTGQWILAREESSLYTSGVTSGAQLT
jgi:hypothetical protein